MALLAFASRRFPHILAGILFATGSFAQPIVVSDITNHHAEAAAIRNIVSQGVMEAPRGKFRPDAPMTRADLAASVQRLFDLKSPAVATNFPDVPSMSPFYPSVEAVAPYLGRQILCFGCALKSTFLPEAPASELEFAVLVTNVLLAQKRLALVPGPEAEAVLTNVPNSGQLRGPLLRAYVATAIRAGIILPPKSDRLTSVTAFSRAQGAGMLNRVQNKFTITKVRRRT